MAVRDVPLPPAVERFSSTSHLAGAALALIGLVALVQRGLAGGGGVRLLGLAVYGASLVVLYSASGLYHAVQGPAKGLFRKVDHFAIYLLIAGTYTPFALALDRGMGRPLLIGIWALAALGFLLESVPHSHAVTVGLYLAMGWLAVSDFGPMAAGLGLPGIVWLGLGGIFYTVGAGFYGLDRRHPAAHGVFHLLVLAGSASHFVAVWRYVA